MTEEELGPLIDDPTAISDASGDETTLSDDYDFDPSNLAVMDFLTEEELGTLKNLSDTEFNRRVTDLAISKMCD